MISKEKQQALKERMAKLSLNENDLIEKFILGGGRGGQKVNTTSSCVYLKHIPSGIEIKCQKERSRELNRYYARRLLCEKLEEILFKEKSAKKQALEKLRKQKKRRSRKHKAKLVEEKRARSTIKQLRKPPTLES